MKIQRFELRGLVASATNTHNRFSISLYINELIHNGFLERNPDSEYMNKKGCKNTEVYMPNNESRNFIKIDKIHEWLNELNQKMVNPHSPIQTTISNDDQSNLTDL